MPQTIPAPMSTPASKITASTAYAGMNKDACQQGNSMIGEQLRGYQQPSLLFNVVPTAEDGTVSFSFSYTSFQTWSWCCKTKTFLESSLLIFTQEQQTKNGSSESKGEETGEKIAVSLK
ncbi:uncharacterized protein [Periplaneta americana]|uniref:uncharacterized protein n=1 Tax=Periplaneta americana TaxID=6978 RepID=UPI0037E89A89